MMRKIAFAGFRHPHINGLFQLAEQSSELEITAVAEEDPEALAAFQAAHPDLKAKIYTNIDTMLAEADCDIIATGDYFAKRGSILIRALQAGKHVISDKPLCTSLSELAEIEKLSKAKGLSVGCMLDLRTGDNFAAAHDLVRSGKLGEIAQIQFSGQHPLNAETRAHWYFEPGKHGGTINDIAIHAFDFIPWMTGLEFRTCAAARTWRAFDSKCDCFNDAAQIMLVMNNGCGILGDVSYSEPSSHGFKMPQYWRFTVWGTQGVIEFNSVEPGIKTWFQNESAAVISPEIYTGPTYLDSFLMELSGGKPELNTEWILHRARQVLNVQKQADTSRF